MDFKGFFEPASVAVVGASRNPGKVGYEILHNLISGGYEGKIYPVNPNASEVQGLKSYAELSSIGERPELVIIIVPASLVHAVVQQCCRVGVKSVIIITAGFKEVGGEGAVLEQRIIQTARSGGIRILGPNSLGLIVPSNKLNASFGGEMPFAGVTGYISQSGALAAAVLDIAGSYSLGFSKMVSIGNKADIDELDVLKELGSDNETKVIAGYLESINDGEAFVKTAEQISHSKPILLVKSGKSPSGAQAASSHTGSLAGRDIAYDCVFERAGIIRCDSIEEQVNYARAFAKQPLPKGTRVAVITNAGGAGIMAADAIEQQGLTFAELSDKTVEKLGAKLPPTSNLRNPVDILCNALAERYEHALASVVEEPNVDIILVLLTPQAMTQPVSTAEAIVKISRQTDKIIFASFLGSRKVEEGIRILRRGKIPHYSSLETAVATMKVMTDYSRWRTRPQRVVKFFPVNRRKAQGIIEKHIGEQEGQIGEVESKEILQAYGFVVPESGVATTSEQAAEIAEKIGFPVVLKVWSPEIVHKTEAGGVKRGLQNSEEVMDAFDLIMYRMGKKYPEVNIPGAVVQEMVKTGQEMILGMTRDMQCGPLMMFGMGGTMVEVIRDISFYLAPLTPEEARRMLARTKTYQMLLGVRGQEGVDIDSITEGLQRLSQLVTEFPQIREIEINPYIVGPKGLTAVAVDARMRVE